LVRPMILLDGVTSDLSAIEARVLAWLAGEDWVLQAFIEGRDLYVETADRMGGGMGRPEGKIAVLAAGYQGSVGSFRAMGYGGRRCPFDLTPPTPKMVKGKETKQQHAGNIEAAKKALMEKAKDLVRDEHDLVNMVAYEAYIERAWRMAPRDEDPAVTRERIFVAFQGHVAERRRDPSHKCDVEILEIVRAWREANSRIKEFWYDLERKFWTGGVVGRIRIEKTGEQGRTRLVHLPSGRVLRYYGVHKRDIKKKDPETGEETGQTKKQLYYTHVQGYSEKTYGGRLTENITQAVARDLLADALIRMHRAGYPVVGHVHDEALAESDDTEGIREIMRTGPAWAEDLPLDASAAVLHRYRKD
jgi:hypothetical protein